MKRLILTVLLLSLLSSVSAFASQSLLGVSYDQAMTGLTETFSMNTFPAQSERPPCAVGANKDQLLTLILVGQPKNLQKATLLINAAGYQTDAHLRIMQQFAQNFVGWKSTEVEEMLYMLTQSYTYNRPQKLDEGNKFIEFLFTTDLNLISITVTPRTGK